MGICSAMRNRVQNQVRNRKRNSNCNSNRNSNAIIRRAIFALLGFVMLTMSACNRHSEHWEALSSVENFIEEQPDSALVVLQGIDASTLSSAEERAKHALLLSMALDIDETDLSLISTAKENYEDSKDIRYKFLSHYYYGRVLCNRGDFPQAIIAYTEAENLLERLENNYQAGLLYTQLGNIYRTYFDYNKCLESYQLAYKYYKLSELKSHMAHALLDIGISYWNLEETKLAEEFISNALQMALDNSDPHLERVCYENLVILYDKINDTDRCEVIVNRLVHRFEQSAYSPACLASIASYYVDVKQSDLVEHFLGCAWNNVSSDTDSIALNFLSANIMKKMGKTDDAWKYFGDGIKIQNNQLRIALQQPILSAQKNYFEDKARYNSYRLKRNTEIYITLSVIALLIIIVIVMYSRHRMLAKDLEINKYMELAEELQSSIRAKELKLQEMSEMTHANDDNSNMSSHMAELFHRQYELLDRLSKTYYETHGFKIEKDIIFEQVKFEINKFANDKKSLAQLENIVNTYKHNVIALIRAEVPNITERDIKLLCYIYAGFSSKSISIFTGETTGNVITRKYRLRNKILKLDTPNKNIMVEEMP